jgi:RNA polymerase sigma factor for flagellar operon FliA
MPRGHRAIIQKPLTDVERELVERYLPLVQDVADRITFSLPLHVDKEDCYSLGVLGLMAAVRVYKPEQDHTFAGYASMRIRGAILDGLRRADLMPRRARAKVRQVNEAIRVLEQRLGRSVTEKEICVELGWTPAQYREHLVESRPGGTTLSMDSLPEGIDGEDGMSLGDRMPDPEDVLGCSVLEAGELLELLERSIQALTDVQRKVLGNVSFRT